MWIYKCNVQHIFSSIFPGFIQLIFVWAALKTKEHINNILKSWFNCYLRKTANILLLSFPACGKMHSRIQYPLVVFQEALFSWKKLVLMKSDADVLSNVDYDSQKSCYERSKKRQHSPFCQRIRFLRPQARKRRWGCISRQVLSN